MPHPIVDQDPESQPGPDPDVDSEALAEQNHTLKQKLLEAVRVGNGCYYALERTKAKASEREETPVGIMIAYRAISACANSK